MFCLSLTSSSTQNKFQDSYHHSLGATVSATLLHRCTHATLCTCAITPIFFILFNVFLCATPPRQPLDRFRPLPQKFGMHCQVIFRPSQLFFLLEYVSNTILSCVLILQDTRWQLAIGTYHSSVPDTTPPAAIAPFENTKRPAKRVPSECLRLAKVIKPTYFGARINAALHIYLLTTWTIFLWG